MRGFRAIPRWATDPVPGVGRYALKVPARLMAELRALSAGLGVPFSSVLLTGHAKVLSALSGEHEVCTGWAAGDGPPLPLRMSLAPRSWRGVMLETARAQSEGERHGQPPDSGPDAAPTAPSFETVWGPGEGGGELGDGIVLRVGVAGRDGCELSFHYRTDVLDCECAARIAGYHVTALSLIAADPDADHGRASLLSAGERKFQLHGLSGPRRRLPDRLAHELFEEQARVRPDAIAAMQGERRVTYGELNARANQVARALSARGLAREGVVAVATERNLDWLTAVLAILKAGGAYLPFEPQLPADRISRMLSRAGCRLVLTEHGSTSTLDRALGALPGVERLFIDAACAEGHPDADLRLDIAPDRLAYIYFTSGSTGEPKGAMCEHAGLLNHLLAKIDDLGIGEGDVVAQTAPQGFDISLWQLVSALLVGGRTLIVEQGTVLEAERFVDEIAARRVNVLQVVPSYLEVLVAVLAQRPRGLPDLRFVLATGEALTKELVQRWFAVRPGIRLVNAYGLTETSDDTNHEILERVPDRERIPLGRPVNNVHACILDEHLALVPLGAPGEIAFSGVCVGRGYVNDAERTGLSFGPNPHRSGERLYRSGDFGRWLPGGKLEFLGRRDSQVKVAGVRIEIGEIENALLRVPGVGGGAVVATGAACRARRLVAFYSGERPLDADRMRGRLRETLPESMVPAAFHWRKTLPLTGNGKLDRKALAAIAGELDGARQEREGPESETERWLATRWADVLGIAPDRIDRRAHFFDLGGTSLSALRLAIALDRALSFQELNRHPILADQAVLLERRRVPGVRAAPAHVASGPRETSVGSAARGGERA